MAQIVRSGRFIAALVLGAWCVAASALSLNLKPATGSYVKGDPIFLDVVVDGIQSAGEVLSTYDLDVTYGPGADYVAASNSGALGTSLFLDTPGSGSVNLFEVSFESDATLAGLQSDSFTIATLKFVGTQVGAVDIELMLKALGGSQVDDPANPGFTITRDLFELDPLSAGAVLVIDERSGPLPAPATLWLAGLGLLLLAGSTRRQTR